MPKGLPESKFPSLYSKDRKCEQLARSIQSKTENAQNEWVEFYKLGLIKESTVRYCLNLTGMGDDEIEERIN